MSQDALIQTPGVRYVNAMHVREWNLSHIHIFQVPEIGLTLSPFCSHTDSRQYQQPFHPHNLVVYTAKHYASTQHWYKQYKYALEGLE